MKSIGSALNHSKQNFGNFNPGYKKESSSELFFTNLSKISYDGIMNENYFKISSKESKLLMNLELSKLIIANPYKKTQKDYFIGLMCKSKYDGEEINESIDISIALDISGSMDCNVDFNKDTGKSRIDLAKDALSKLILNLKPNDKFCLTTFNDNSTKIFPLSNKESLLNNLKLLKEIKAGGGTNIYNALNGAIENILESENKNKRIILITDMMDNEPDEKLEKLFKECVNKYNILVTIVAIGNDSNTSLANHLCKEKGCNYFSAVEDEDIEYFLVKNFKYITFPLCYDMKVEIDENKEFEVEKVIGIENGENNFFKNAEAPNNINDNNENNDAPPIININDNFGKIVFEENSVFPSELTIHNGDFYQKGGLIILKIKFLNEDIKPTINFRLNYSGRDGEKYSQNYSIDFNDSINPCDSLETGISLYYYGSIMEEFYREKRNKKDKAFYIEKIDICKKFLQEHYKTYDNNDKMKKEYLNHLEQCNNFYNKY